jgi:EAL domain-containing protein (putative c-di-GMP-specific phosphodiesterase class I)
VRDVVSDPRAQRLVEALARWAGSSRMDTVGGQVESEQVRDQLVRLGIDYIQGFIICKPEPIEKVLSELQPPHFSAKPAQAAIHERVGAAATMWLCRHPR